MLVNELIEKLYRLSEKNYRVVVEDEREFLGLDIVDLRKRHLMGSPNEHVIVIMVKRR